MSDTHYVVVVHGTWNPPDPVNPTWHQLNEEDDSNFCTKLNDALEEKGLGRAIGRELDGQTIQFAWSGRNRHSDRMEAGIKLAELLGAIEEHDPAARIHIVAHSHGGNVVLAALWQYLAKRKNQGQVLSRSINWNRRNMAPELNVEQALRETLSPNAAEARLTSSPIKALLNSKTAGSIYADSDFHKTWTYSNESNRIGTLTFLGTPFLNKHWKQDRTWWRPFKLIGHAINIVSAAVVGALLLYLIYLILSALSVVLLGPIAYLFHYFYPDRIPKGDLSFNPMEWPRFVPLLILAAGVLFSVVAKGIPLLTRMSVFVITQMACYALIWVIIGLWKVSLFSRLPVVRS
jgi:hypothetical protein